jgi:endonuclease YncB( thermonuclease family)
MTNTHRFTALFMAWLLALFLLLAHATAHAQPHTLEGRIVGVTDGDTVTLLDAHHTQTKIRLAGIDAPESRMPYGQKAKAYLATLVFGKDVVAVTSKLDRYGRTIATLMVAGQDANLAMVQAGLAWHYKQYAREQPRTEAMAYAQAEVLARAQGLGLWQDAEPMAPWDWRHARHTSASYRTTRQKLCRCLNRLAFN